MKLCRIIYYVHEQIIPKFGFRSFNFIVFHHLNSVGYWILARADVFLVMPKLRNTYKCPVCGEPVKRLTPHLKVQHMDKMKTAYFCTLYANHARLQGRTHYRGRAYKMCTIADCCSITADMPLHLRGNSHCFTRERSRSVSKSAQPVTDFVWSVPRATSVAQALKVS